MMRRSAAKITALLLKLPSRLEIKNTDARKIVQNSQRGVSEKENPGKKTRVREDFSLIFPVDNIHTIKDIVHKEVELIVNRGQTTVSFS
jgi:hypothetical protein